MLARGSLLKLTKIPEDVERDEVKAAFGEHRADIAHVEMTDDRVAIVRFRSENAASVVISHIILNYQKKKNLLHRILIVNLINIFL